MRSFVSNDDLMLADIGRRWRLAQIEELMMRFREANGFHATNAHELDAWIGRANLERPVKPRDSLVDKHFGHRT